jgi:SulP family sulfate permease
MRHIARVKRSDLVGLGVGFAATLMLGIEIGIGVAVVASMLVVFARMSRPHTAVLGRIPGTTTYRNTARFPEATTVPGVSVVRIDAAVSFINAQHVKRLCLDAAAAAVAEHSEQGEPGVGPALVIDCEGINDVDVTGAEALGEVAAELAETAVEFHLSDVKGPVRDVLQRAGLWDRLAGRIHAGAHDAVVAITDRPNPASLRDAGIDERPSATSIRSATAPNFDRPSVATHP